MSDDKKDDEKKSASWAFTLDKSNLKVDENKAIKEEQLKKKDLVKKDKKLRLDFKSVPKQVSRTKMASEEDDAIEKEMEDNKFFNRVVKPNLAPVLVFAGALIALILYKKFK
jgi:uncharacterized protein (DUF1697 family)